MRKNLCLFLAVAACSLMFSGCGTGNEVGKNADDSVSEISTNTPDASVGTQEASSLETVETGDTNADGVDDTDTAVSAYDGILDMFYYKIMGGWDWTEDVSYMFYWDYTSVKTLSDAGYALTDLDGNGVPELLVSTVEDAADGIIFDLYTFADGEVVHAATSGERYRYHLCADNTIYFWGSSGASNSREIYYGIDPDTGHLCSEEVVAYDENENKNNPWFYGTGECYDEVNGLNYDNMSGITEKEAQDIRNRHQVTAIGLTLFNEYSPQGDMPDEIVLKQAFHSAAGSETELYFVCDDFDGNGSMESFGVTGTDDGIDLEDVRIYYVDSEGSVSCIDTFPYIYGYGGIYPGMNMNWVMDAGNAKFLTVGGADGQETWLYGVRNGAAYQPEVSGQHADFRQTEDGQYIAQPHEGGEGYYTIYYDYDPVTGEFVPKDADGKTYSH